MHQGAQIGEIASEEGVVAASGLGAAFDDVSRRDRSRDRGVVVPAPTEVCRRRTHDDRCIGDPTGDDNVGTGAQTLDYAPGPQIHVGCERRTREPELVGSRQHVVAFDVGDGDPDAEFVGQRADRSCQPCGVEAARICDDPDASVAGDAQAFLELTEERLRVALVGVLHSVAAQDEHRQLGKVVAGQVVELATGQHLAHGGEAITVEARAVSDADRGSCRIDTRGRHWHSCRRRTVDQPTGRLLVTGGTESSPRPVGSQPGRVITMLAISRSGGSRHCAVIPGVWNPSSSPAILISNCRRQAGPGLAGSAITEYRPK